MEPQNDVIDRITKLAALASCGLAGLLLMFPDMGVLYEFQVVVWCVVVFAVGVSAWAFACRLLINEGVLVAVLAAVVIASAVASCVISYPEFFAAFGVVTQLILMGCFCLVSGHGFKSSSSMAAELDTANLPRVEKTVLAGVVSFAFFACCIAALNFVRFTQIESDNMWYHYPMVAEWVRTGSIWPADTIPIVARAYPGYHESIHAFLAAPMRSDHLAITGVVERVIFGLVVCAIALRTSESAFLSISYWRIRSHRAGGERLEQVLSTADRTQQRNAKARGTHRNRKIRQLHEYGIILTYG